MRESGSLGKIPVRNVSVHLVGLNSSDQMNFYSCLKDSCMERISPGSEPRMRYATLFEQTWQAVIVIMARSRSRLTSFLERFTIYGL